MKTILFAVLNLLATVVQAKSARTMAPIVEFPAGRYLGLGHYVTADNQQGTYSSYADIDADSWRVNYLREYGTDAYQVEFTFNDNGSFDVLLFEFIGEEANVYIGQGYCQSVQCHVNVDMGDRLYEETVTILAQEKKIYRLGSISRYSYDTSPIVMPPRLTMSWEESMIRIDSSDANKIIPKL